MMQVNQVTYNEVKPKHYTWEQPPTNQYQPPALTSYNHLKHQLRYITVNLTAHLTSTTRLHNQHVSEINIHTIGNNSQMPKENTTHLATSRPPPPIGSRRHCSSSSRRRPAEIQKDLHKMPLHYTSSTSTSNRHPNFRHDNTLLH
jgi:hypothetical protein